MARRNERGLELSFHKATGRWLKIIDGKKEYFGYGKGVTDRDGYKDAMARYREFMDTREARQDEKANASRLGHALTLLEDEDQAMDAGKPLPNIDRSQVLRDLVATEALPEPVAAMIDPKLAPPAAPEGTGIKALCDAYLMVQQQRRDLTKANPEALPRKQRLSTNSYRGLEYCVVSFREYALNQARINSLADPAQVERLLMGYRQHLEAAMIKGTIKPSTVNAKVVYLTPLFLWLWKARHIAELPRCLDEICKKYAPQPSASPLPVAVIKKLWDAADGRMQALIALGLNCGMYAMELATVKGEHIVGDHICKHRNKTQVPYKIKLWKITQDLIQEYRDGEKPDDLLFKTKNGFPLVHEGPKCKSDSVSQAFSKLAEAAGVEASWSQLRDTSATLIEKIATDGKGLVDKGLVSQFLAHADTRTARFYVQQDPKLLPTAKLDAAIDALAKTYGLDKAGWKRKPKKVKAA